MFVSIPVGIEQFLNNKIVEYSRIEIKEDWEPTPVAHSICAFANDIDNIGGGYIIIGVAEDNGVPVFPVKGLDQNRIDKIQKEIMRVGKLLQPNFIPVINRRPKNPSAC